MARLAGTLSRYEAIGIRENLSDVIYTISPAETPILSNAGKIKVQNTDFEWQTDALAAAGANAQLDADEVSFSTTAVTTRLKNYTQISRKDVLISGTLEATNRAGRQSELSYQAAKRGKELKRDMEATIASNVAANAGAAATARTTGTLLATIKTNTSIGAAGANPVTIITTTRTDGTPRALTEAMVKTVAQAIWTSGGELKMAVMPGTVKQAFSALAGIAQLRKEAPGAKAATIIGAADVYVSDFGSITLVPDRFMRTGANKEILFLDSDYYSIATLRPFQTIELAKTGDAEKRMMLVEWGLQVNNEAALGGIFDLS